MKYSSRCQRDEWNSSDESIASVDSSGKVTLNGAGTVTITLTAYVDSYSVFKSVTFTVKSNDTTTTTTTTPSPTEPMIIPQSLKMNPGDTNTLLVLNVPDGASVSWTSDNTSVATVSDGIVTAVAPGTATIYAIVGGKLCSCTIDVVTKGYIPGDADGDGVLGISDVVIIMMYASNKEAHPMSEDKLNNADVYNRGDGVFISDALSIQKRLAQVISSLPESYLS